MTPADNFEYDVAFSFHSLDESIAFQLNDRLQTAIERSSIRSSKKFLPAAMAKTSSMKYSAKRPAS